MATIDQLDISVYSNYALRVTLIEQINTQLRIKEDASIAPQLQMVDISPKMTELDLVLGIIPLATPWASFLPPPNFRSLRRSPFAFYRVAPSFGPFNQEEEEEKKLDEIECETSQDDEEKAILKNCLAQMHKINDMINYIMGRIGQFLQG